MFRDRKDAAIQLAKSLEKYEGQEMLVLGIPRGGAETGYYVAQHLGAKFSLIIARKLSYPFSPETAMGALAEDGSLYVTDMASERHKDIAEARERERKEIRRRIEKFRHGKSLPEIKGRTVLLVDDGIATGATLFAAIRMCRNKKARKVVVAAPVSSLKMEEILRQMVDEVVILEKPDHFQAVSQVYQSFGNLTDEETVSFMEKWQEEYEPQNSDKR